MCPVANDLDKGDALPDGDEVARYCTPNRYDPVKGEPSHLAFMRRPKERDPSVNRLESFVCCSRTDAVDCVRQEVEKHLKIGLGGRFVIFNVKRAKIVAKKEGFDINVVYDPILPDQLSHSLITNFPKDNNAEVRVATAIKRLIANTDIYPAKL